MILPHQNRVVCDGCDADMELPITESDDELLDELKTLGWGIGTDDFWDYCPRCSEEVLQ